MIKQMKGKKTATCPCWSGITRHASNRNTGMVTVIPMACHRSPPAQATPLSTTRRKMGVTMHLENLTWRLLTSPASRTLDMTYPLDVLNATHFSQRISSNRGRNRQKGIAITICSPTNTEKSQSATIRRMRSTYHRHRDQSSPPIPQVRFPFLAAGPHLLRISVAEADVSVVRPAKFSIPPQPQLHNQHQQRGRKRTAFYSCSVRRALLFSHQFSTSSPLCVSPGPSGCAALSVCSPPPVAVIDTGLASVLHHSHK